VSLLRLQGVCSFLHAWRLVFRRSTNVSLLNTLGNRGYLFCIYPLQDGFCFKKQHLLLMQISYACWWAISFASIMSGISFHCLFQMTSFLLLPIITGDISKCEMKLHRLRSHHNWSPCNGLWRFIPKHKNQIWLDDITFSVYVDSN